MWCWGHPGAHGTPPAELHQMSGQRAETDNEERRAGDEKKSDCGGREEGKREKNTRGNSWGIQARQEEGNEDPRGGARGKERR